MDTIADLPYSNYRDFRDSDRGPLLPAADDWIYPSYAQLGPYPPKASLSSMLSSAPQRPPDQSYPSPSPSVPSPGPGSSASGTSTPPDEMFSPTAREPQLGPVRHPRTRQLSLSYGRIHARRHSADSQSGGECDMDDNSRPQSPYAFDSPDLPLHPANGLSLHIPTHMDGSPYQPATPASLSSGSPYGYDDYRGPSLDARPPSPPNSRDQSLEYNAHLYDDANSAYHQQPAAKGRNRGPLRKHTKKKLDGAEKKRICQYHLDNQSARQEDIAEMFGIERSTVSKILKLKAHWLNVDDECATLDKRRPSKFPAIESDMVTWLRECLANNTPIHDSGIRKQALLIAKQHDITEDRFKASSGWIENFKHRHNIRSGKWIGSKYEFMGTYDDGVSTPASNVHEFTNPGQNGHGPAQGLKLPVLPNSSNPYRTPSSGSSLSSRSSSSESLVRNSLMAEDASASATDPTKDGEDETAPTTEGSAPPQPQEPLWSASSTAPVASSSAAHHTEHVLPPPLPSHHYDHERSSYSQYSSQDHHYPHTSSYSDDVYMRPPVPSLGGGDMVVQSLVPRGSIAKKISAEDAEHAVEKVAMFLHQEINEGNHIVSREHREVLRRISVQISEWASGLPQNTPP